MKLPSCHRLRALALAALGASAVSLFTIERQPLADTGVPTTMMEANIATEPLYANYSGDVPTMALSLSVEYPTVGAQYAAPVANATSDSTYDPAKEYIGYFNTEMCYEYVDKPTETVPGKTTDDLKRFRISGKATKRKCNDAFSGNFMNWATGSGIDMLRLALSGGDRYIDTKELTILQRAYLPDGSNSNACFFNSTNFPGKELKKDAGGGNNFAGAVPKAMRNFATNNGSSSIWVGNLYNRVYFARSKGEGNCSSAPPTYQLPQKAGLLSASGENYYFARVQVCDDKDERDYPMCAEQPSGYKKPTGVIQKYSDRLRLAAFGYALEQTLSHNNGVRGRTGGVLRAPMKFVGHTMMDKDGRDITAAALEDGRLRPEWDAETGVYAQNPEGDTRFGISGVINYLNQFGRTSPTQKGVYKTYDPASELYYETLRYLQGLSPTAAAVANLKESMYDGFPIYTDWTGLDPYGSKAEEGGYSKDDDYSCSRSSIVFIGDVNTHDAKHYSGTLMPSTDVANNIPDIAHWLSVVQHFEMGKSMSYVDGQGNTQTTRNPNPASYSSFQGGYNGRGRTAEIIGLSYWAHTHDIRGTGWTAEADKEDSKQRPGLRVTSYFFDVNEYGNGNNNATRQKNNQYFTAAKYGGFLTGERADGLYNTTGNPFYDANGNATNEVWSDLRKKIGDNTDPVANPEARTYFMPANGRETLAAFEEIFSAAGSMQQRSIAGAANYGGLTGTNYQALYNSESWGGDVLAESFGGGAPLWSANAVLKADIAAKGHGWRKIFMGYEDSDDNPRAFAFTAATACDVDDVEEDLNADDERCADRVNWLRGAQVEGFRERGDFVLGDIINSGVKHVGAPSPAQNLGAGYAEFAAADGEGESRNVAGRTAAVYVGANDGMLHAFDALTGSELFAYIPSWMAGKLAALTETGYRHQMYVDATPVIGDAVINAKPSHEWESSDWASVLVGGTGGGGKGVFALDVTEPDKFDADKVLWEFTDDDDPDMGYVLGSPRIVKLLTAQADTSTTPPTPAQYRWFAMVPSGVNSYVDDDDDDGDDGGVRCEAGGERTCAPTIFLLAMDKAPGAEWSKGTNYWKVTLPFDATLAASIPTGVLNLEAFTGLGRVTEYVYAGDLHGKLWALKFKGHTTGQWSAATLAAPYVSGGTALPLFIATDGEAKPQPITAAPTIMEGAGNGTHFVSFGTGKYFEKGDVGNRAQQSFYTLYSNFNDSSDAITGMGASVIGPRMFSLSQTVRAEEGETIAPAKPFYWGWTEQCNPEEGATTCAGWYYDFEETGERQVADATWLSMTSQLIFSSLIPDTAAGGLCGSAGGNAKVYTFDMISGKGVRNNSQVGMLGQPLVMFDTPTETPADATGRRLRIIPIVIGQFGTDGSAIQSGGRISIPFGRLSWRRVDNFQQMKAEYTAAQ